MNLKGKNTGSGQPSDAPPERAGPDGEDIATRLGRVHAEIAACEARHGRPPGSVKLIAVSKTQPAAAVAAAHDAGQRAFGENYLQEAGEKMDALAGRDIEWHYIGGVQSNKTADIAARFDWVHTVDREKIARRLNDQRPEGLAPLNVCIQVNVSGEATKGGIEPGALGALAETVAGCPRLALRGLMALPAPEPSFERQRAAFEALAKLAAGCPVPLEVLSIGTSADFEAAIAAGATHVRIGTAVFGPRAPKSA